MNRTKLIFNGMSEIVGSDGMAVILLTDEGEKRAISVVCDKAMKYQIAFRKAEHYDTSKYLPEVLMAVMGDVNKQNCYEINIHSIVDGEYMTTLIDLDSLNIYQIRLSDAILFSLIANIPIYIENSLMNKQSIAYNSGSERMAIPINTLDTEKLKEEFNKAIETENYRLAALIKDELNNRTQKTDLQ